VTLMAPKTDNRLSAKLAEKLVSEEDFDFDSVPLELSGYAPRGDPLEGPGLV